MVWYTIPVMCCSTFLITTTAKDDDDVSITLLGPEERTAVPAGHRREIVCGSTGFSTYVGWFPTVRQNLTTAEMIFLGVSTKRVRVRLTRTLGVGGLTDSAASTYIGR